MIACLVKISFIFGILVAPCHLVFQIRILCLYAVEDWKHLTPLLWQAAHQTTIQFVVALHLNSRSRTRVSFQSSQSKRDGERESHGGRHGGRRRGRNGGGKQSGSPAEYITLLPDQQRTASSFSCKTCAVFDSTFVKNQPSNMQSLDERGLSAGLLLFLSCPFFPFLSSHTLSTTENPSTDTFNCHQHESQAISPFLFQGEKIITGELHVRQHMLIPIWLCVRVQ